MHIYLSREYIDSLRKVSKELNRSYQLFVENNDSMLSRLEQYESSLGKRYKIL